MCAAGKAHLCETGAPCVAQAGFRLTIVLLQPPKELGLHMCTTMSGSKPTFHVTNI